MMEIKSSIQYNRTHPHREILPSTLRKKIGRRMKLHNSRRLVMATTGTQTPTNGLQTRIDRIVSGRHALDSIRVVDRLADHLGHVNSKQVIFNIIPYDIFSLIKQSKLIYVTWVSLLGYWYRVIVVGILA